MLSEGATELGPVLGPVGSDAFALNGAIAEILKYSLLRRDPKARTLEIHRLVQAVLQQAMDEVTQRLWAERAVRAVGRAFPSREFSTWAVCERLLPQAQACAELIVEWGFEFAEAARLLKEAGFYLFQRSRYTEARPLCEQAVAIWERALGPEHPDVAWSLSAWRGFTASKAGTRRRRCSFAGRSRSGKKRGVPSTPTWPTASAAWRCFTTTKPVRGGGSAVQASGGDSGTRALGPEHPDVAWSFTIWRGFTVSKAGTRRRNHCTGGRWRFRRSARLRASRRSQQPQRPGGASSQHQPPTGRPSRCFDGRWPSKKRVLGREHSDVATSLNNLAGLYYNQGQYAKAEPLYQRALAIREKALGPEHPDVAQSLNNLAVLYEPKANTGRPSPFSGGRWRSGKRPWAPSTPTWRHPWKTTRSCYETWVVGGSRTAGKSREGHSG